MADEGGPLQKVGGVPGAEPKKAPPSIGGGVIGTTAAKLLQRSEFEGVPQPEVVAECVVRWLRDQNQGARSGIRAVMTYYRNKEKFPKLVEFLQKVYLA